MSARRDPGVIRLWTIKPGWNRLSQIMKSSSKTLIAIIAVVILAGTAFLIVRLHGHRPHAQPPHAAGAYILKKQFAFAGYATPEAALESMIWAFFNGDYDMAMSSVGPKDQADLKKQFGGNPKRFKSEMRRESAQIKGAQILARKTVSADKVELKFQIVAPGDSGGRVTTNCIIQPLVKIGNEWKLVMNENTQYKTNWDQSGEIQTFVQ
jgi:hypothetical protein